MNPMKKPPFTDDQRTGASRLGKLTWERGELSAESDLIATETPVALVYNGVSHAVMMATPNDLEDFALGFSLTEGILERATQLLDIDIRQQDKGIEVQLTITQESFMALKQRRRTLSGRTGCGICGVEALNQLLPALDPVPQGNPVAHQQLQEGMAALLDRQPLQSMTGAVHAAAWCTASGDIQFVREDVGRHNALDKVIGAFYRQRNPYGADTAPEGFILVTSRASYEMVAKSARAGVGLLAAVSAPTSLAISLAEDCGMTLVGFTRAGRHVVYTHADRLVER